MLWRRTGTPQLPTAQGMHCFSCMACLQRDRVQLQRLTIDQHESSAQEGKTRAGLKGSSRISRGQTVHAKRGQQL